MTSGSRIASRRDDFAHEDELVEESHRGRRRAAWLISNAVPKLRGGWLAEAEFNWDAVYVSGNPIGHDPPAVPTHLKREFKQRSWQRHRNARREEFLKLIRGAT